MKDQILKITTLLAIIALGLYLPSCSDDDDNKVVPSIQLSETSLSMNKLGLTETGDSVSFNVKSNVYWEIVLDKNAPWLNTSIKGGSGQTEIILRAEKNEGTPRSATLTLETLEGTTVTLNISQNSSDEEILFVQENMGTTSAEMALVNDFLAWQKTGLGSRRIEYSGIGAVVDKEEPSTGYMNASGDNNIFFADAGAEFTFGPIDTKLTSYFTLRFGAKTTQSLFNKDELTLFISNDGTNWVDAYYNRDTNSEWGIGEYKFYMPKPARQIYFKFVSTVGSAYRIDDILLDEGVQGEGVEITFEQILDDGKPEGFVYFEDDFTWVDFGGGDHLTNAGAGPRTDGLGNNAAIFATAGWGVATKFVYVRPGYLQLGRAADAGGVISPKIKKRLLDTEYPTVPAQTGIAIGKMVNVIVTFSGAVHQSNIGENDNDGYSFEVLGAGSLNPEGTVTSQVIQINSFHVWRDNIPMKVYNATSETQIKLVAPTGANRRLYFDNFKVVKTYQE